jgi:hypothetical protein
VTGDYGVFHGSVRGSHVTWCSSLKLSSSAISSAPSEKSKTAAFSMIRRCFADFGMVTKPFCRDQRRSTCAGVRRALRATIAKRRSLSFIGDDSNLTRLAEGNGVTLLAPWVKFDLVHCRRNLGAAEELLEMVDHKLLTPIVRQRPSLRMRSSARQECRRRSGTGQWRRKRSIWSNPSRR